MLANEDYLQVLTCIESIHRCRSLVDFPKRILGALSTLVPNNLSAFNEVNAARNRITAITDRPIVDHSNLAAVWQRHSSQHPLLRYNTDTGDGQAVKISDFLTTPEYHRLELYQEFYRRLEAEDQMTLTIRSDAGIFLTLAFNRARRDFTESDRLKLNLVRPHILQAYANAEELADQIEEKEDLKTALRETGHGMVELEGGRVSRRATPGAVEKIAGYFPDWDAADGLPPAIVDWLREGETRMYEANSSHGRLIVRRAGHPDRGLLLLSEEIHGDWPGSAGLTPRESEVLKWLAEGKTNPEISRILGIAPGTVKVHVERILGKLGVENRLAAMLLVHRSGFRDRSDP